jgi:hypothetical protein
MPAQTEVEGGLDKIIAQAISTKVDAAIATALAGDEILGQYVVAALQTPVQVGDNYRKKEVPFLKHVIDQTLQAAVKAAVQKYIAEQTGELEAAVLRELRAQTKAVAGQLVGSLVEQAQRPYGISVQVNYPGRD